MDHRQCVGNDAFNPARAFVYSNASFSSALGSPATVAVSRSRSSAETAAKAARTAARPTSCRLIRVPSIITTLPNNFHTAWAHFDILHRGGASVANGAYRKSMDTRLLPRAALMNHSDRIAQQ